MSFLSTSVVRVRTRNCSIFPSLKCNGLFQMKEADINQEVENDGHFNFNPIKKDYLVQ